jgi:hypothetical protein
MLRIKPEQVEHFANRTRDRFVAMMTGYLRTTFPDRVAGWDDPALTTWTQSALHVCERAGVDTEPEAAQLILLLLRLGIDAEERFDWAREAASDRALSPEGKVRAFIGGALAQGLPIQDLIVFEDLQPAGADERGVQ